MAARLHAALAEQRIRAAYQPIIALADATIVAEEALARFVATDGVVTPAGAFIEAEAACDPIIAIDEVMLNQTLARCSARRVLGLPVRLHFVNVSTALFAAPDLLTHLAAAVEVCGTPWPQNDPRWRSLVIEITERELIRLIIPVSSGRYDLYWTLVCAWRSMISRAATPPFCISRICP